MDLSGKRVLVIGLGRTGVATAGFLLDKGARVLAADEKPVSELGDAIEVLDGVA
ncbi:MAG: UDP-N-acetylmuramoyl-L-alanine--D-glutamate ligase, partial [Deltaproteobacteria bacterium]|nr:UDP-N-acetylmuramoyl-L-alanine--D-glutamate ligase [Deltaproteobacteria bacterium]